MSCVWLVIPPCLAHNDSCVEGVAAAPRPACHLTAHEESPHEDHPPDVPLTSTYARRHADTQLFPPHHRWVSALCGPVRQALWHLTRLCTKSRVSLLTSWSLGTVWSHFWPKFRSKSPY